jgi:amino acid transporter
VLSTGARTTYAAARERTGLSWIGSWDGNRGITANAIIALGIVSIGLVVLGATYQGFATLVDYTAPVYWAFLTASGLAVIVLRRKMPDQPRPFKVPFYPVLPVVFATSSALMLWSSLNYVKVGALFGPIMIAYFTTLAVLGLMKIAELPEILWSLSPVHAVSFFADDPLRGFLALGSVVLAVTGAEALYADMGHFGRRPIRLSWLWIVLPGLMLN